MELKNALIAQANANRRFQSNSSNTPAHPTISTQPSCTSCSNAVSLGEYQKIKQKANAAIDRAMKAEQSAKKYQKKFYNAHTS